MVPVAPGSPVELNDETFASFRAIIAPKPDELYFEGVEWRPQLWTALVEAQGRDMPLLLWAMNGHPMACT